MNEEKREIRNMTIFGHDSFNYDTFENDPEPIKETEKRFEKIVIDCLKHEWDEPDTPSIKDYAARKYRCGKCPSDFVCGRLVLFAGRSVTDLQHSLVSPHPHGTEKNDMIEINQDYYLVAHDKDKPNWMR